MNVIILEDRPADSQVGQAIASTEQDIDHLVELRASEETRSQFADCDEEALWRLKGKIEFILSSIQVERETINLRAAE